MWISKGRVSEGYFNFNHVIVGAFLVQIVI
jgi:hypothetical protein